MAVTDVNVIDGIAFDDDNKTLIMEIYDHLHFEGKFLNLIILLYYKDKLNTYLWYILRVSNMQIFIQISNLIIL